MPITVSCLSYDPHAQGIPKYPHGPATRWIRRTIPDVAQLTPLASWLVAHLPASVAGRWPTLTGNLRCEGLETERQALRRQRPALAERLIVCYGISETQPTVIESWLFPQIQPHETDTDYWNRVAQALVQAGTACLSIDGSHYIIAAARPHDGSA